MFVCSYGSITDVFGEVSRNVQNACFGDLWKVGERVGTVVKSGVKTNKAYERH